MVASKKLDIINLVIIEQKKEADVFPIDKDGFRSMRFFSKTQSIGNTIYKIKKDEDGYYILEKHIYPTNEISWIFIQKKELTHLLKGGSLIVDEDVLKIKGAKA